MKRLTSAAAAFLLAWMCWELSLVAQQSASSRVVISIIGTNDLHGGILPRDGRGGLALLGGYLKNLRAVRARDGGAVVLIDAGDMFQGTLESNLSEGAPVVAAYNALGYAAASIGNHEFDYGPVGEAAMPMRPTDDPRGALKARASEAHFPFLAANIFDSATGQPMNWPNVKPSVMLEATGIKIGIVGVVTSEAFSATMAGNVRGLRLAPLAPVIAAEATKLRAAGAAIVVVTSHAGGVCTEFERPEDLSSCERDAEIMGVARALPAGLVDVIVAGHIHQGVAHEIAGIAVIESYSGGRAFGRVDLTFDRTERRVTARRIFPPHDMASEIYEGAPVVPDPAIEQTLAPAVEGASVLKATPVGVTLDTPITRQPGSESALGNLFADLMRQAAPASDAAITNSGGVRRDLPAGPLTYGAFFEAIPFDNRLVSLTITGAQLRRVFENNFRQTTVRLPVSGLRVRSGCESGALRVTLVRDSGAPVRDDERLVIVTGDFIALGGDNILTPLGEVGYTDLPGPGMRDAMVEQLKKRGGRLRSSDLLNPQQPRIVYPPVMPARCAA